MYHTDRAIIVEGKYDQIRLASLTDALIVTTEGFGVFSDKEKQRFIKTLAREKGLLILTDSDAAGFRIRALIRNIAADADIINAYIPDVVGKEHRKDAPSKEGKLGVEGMGSDALEAALLKSECFTEIAGAKGSAPITASDLFEAGLTGKTDSARRRRLFLQDLGLPARLTGGAMLKTLNALMTRDEFLAKAERFSD